MLRLFASFLFFAIARPASAESMLLTLFVGDELKGVMQYDICVMRGTTERLRCWAVDVNESFAEFAASSPTGGALVRSLAITIDAADLADDKTCLRVFKHRRRRGLASALRGLFGFLLKNGDVQWVMITASVLRQCTGSGGKDCNIPLDNRGAETRELLVVRRSHVVDLTTQTDGDQEDELRRFRLFDDRDHELHVARFKPRGGTYRLLDEETLQPWRALLNDGLRTYKDFRGREYEYGDIVERAGDGGRSDDAAVASRYAELLAERDAFITPLIDGVRGYELRSGFVVVGSPAADGGAPENRALLLARFKDFSLSAVEQSLTIRDENGTNFYIIDLGAERRAAAVSVKLLSKPRTAWRTRCAVFEDGIGSPIGGERGRGRIFALPAEGATVNVTCDGAQRIALSTTGRCEIRVTASAYGQTDEEKKTDSSLLFKTE